MAHNVSLSQFTNNRSVMIPYLTHTQIKNGIRTSPETGIQLIKYLKFKHQTTTRGSHIHIDQSYTTCCLNVFMCFNGQLRLLQTH